MRDQRQVQLAHDVMHAIAAKEVDLRLCEADRVKFQIAHDVLSWVLAGPCGDPFQAILVQTIRAAEELGYSLERVQ